MEKTTLTQSYVNMAELIKKSNGKFFTAFMLVMIPVLMICCYSFYVVYGGTGINYSALDGINITEIISGGEEAYTEFQEALMKVFPDVNYKQSFGDVVLDILNVLMIVFLDAYFVLLSVNMIFEKKYPDSVLFKEALKRIPAVLFISILASFFIYEIEGIVYSGVFMVLSSLYIGSGMFVVASAVSAMFILGICLIISCWLLLIVRYCAISTISGRCKAFLALGYTREVLKGRTWRQMFRIMPFVIVGFILPFIIQSVAIAFAYNTVISVGLVAISTLLQMTVFSLMWIYTVPEFFNNEKESGIQEKIQEMLAKAMNMGKTEEKEDTNSEENNSDDESEKE